MKESYGLNKNNSCSDLENKKVDNFTFYLFFAAWGRCSFGFQQPTCDKNMTTIIIMIICL